MMISCILERLYPKFRLEESYMSEILMNFCIKFDDQTTSVRLRNQTSPVSNTTVVFIIKDFEYIYFLITRIG